MKHFLQAVRETAATKSGTEPEQLSLMADIRHTRRLIETARNHFEEAVDPTMIDCYIYELNAAQLRYQFLLRKLKSWEN